MSEALDMNQVSKSGLLKFRTVGTWGRLILYYGDVLCMAARSAASVTSAHQMPVVQPPFLNVLRDENSPWLRTTILTQNNTKPKKSKSIPQYAITARAKWSSINNTELRRPWKAHHVKFTAEKKLCHLLCKLT